MTQDAQPAEVLARLNGRVFRAPAQIEREWIDATSNSHMVLLRFDLIDQLEAKEVEPLKYAPQNDGLDGFRALLAEFPEWGDWRSVHR